MAVTGDGGAARRRHSVFPPALPPRTIPGRIPTAAGKACEEIAPPVFTFLRRPPVTQQGIVIFALQLLLIVLIPVLDDGGRLVPLPYAASSLAVATLTVRFLGYQRTAGVIAAVGIATILWEIGLPRVPSLWRFPLWLTMIAAGILSAGLCIKTAFALRVPPVQRIFCGAASFVLIGFVFASIHAIVGLGDGIGYTLVGGVENARPLRWVDFVWLSFSTLTTAGFGDVAPVNAAACAVSTLESLCGILFPATLIARIASLPAAPGENGG